jgi:uncharacterized membrane protein
MMGPLIAASAGWVRGLAVPFADIVMGERRWLAPAVVMGLLLLALVIWSYWSRATARTNRVIAGCLKLLALAALLACLVDPRMRGTRPRQGANVFAVVVDNSHSMAIRAEDAKRLRSALATDASWRTRLAQDFDVRNYTFDSQVRHVGDFSGLTLNGLGSSLITAVSTVTNRLKHRPIAGVLLFTDGNATDVDQSATLPEPRVPIYPVVAEPEKAAGDLRVADVHVSQTDFEASPTTLTARVVSTGLPDQPITGRLVDSSGKVVHEETASKNAVTGAAEFRFRFRPEAMGVHYYRFEAFLKADATAFQAGRSGRELTFRNNSQTVVVDRGEGPFRILYLAGRPNWEFKFLRRALDEDPEIELLGLIRIAKKEPKFAFRDRGRVGDQNQLFEGFAEGDSTDTEAYDQPVLVRLGVSEELPLRDGFPKTEEELFGFHAVIIDELEAAFLSQDQMLLLRKFVSHRGGGLLMLGGQESFAKSFDRTVFSDLLPVYIADAQDSSREAGVRWQLTREGMLQTWTRTRSTDLAEQQEASQRPVLWSVNQVKGTKPGASELAAAESATGEREPLLVTQRFGQGRSAALLVGDLWRWSLQRADHKTDDLAQLWRQTARWLVADSLRRVDVEISPYVPGQPVSIRAIVRDEKYQPLDNARVTLSVSTPAGRELTIDAQPADDPGIYRAEVAPREDGGYRVTASAKAEDGSEVGQRSTGFVAEPSVLEFQSVTVDRDRIDSLARNSGGQVIGIGDLNPFVASLSTRKIPVTDPWVYPLWHQPLVLGLVMLCLCGEWCLRRWKGLP